MRKSWATAEQDTWLTALLPAFLKAKETKGTPDFVAEKVKLFHEQWPVISRTEDLIAAKSDESVAKHLALDARKRVCLVLHPYFTMLT